MGKCLQPFPFLLGNASSRFIFIPLRIPRHVVTECFRMERAGLQGLPFLFLGGKAIGDLPPSGHKSSDSLHCHNFDPGQVSSTSSHKTGITALDSVLLDGDTEARTLARGPPGSSVG